MSLSGAGRSPLNPLILRPNDDTEVLIKVMIFLLRQVGGSIALSDIEQSNILEESLDTLEIFKNEIGVLTIRIKDDQ
jgi:hypothetical protein